MGTGGHNQLGQKAGIPERQMHRLLHQVFDLGIHYFDTSPGYRDSELILGHALRSLPRDKIVVSTKVALASNETFEPLSTKAVIESVEASLRRLQLDEIDLLLLAARHPQTIGVAVEEHIPAIQRLIEQGKVRFVGSSEVTRSDDNHEWLRTLLPAGVVDVVMVGHNMLNQSAEQWVLPYCVEHNIGAINVFTVRKVFSDATRLRQIITELRNDDLLPSDCPDNPFEYLLSDAGIESVIEACYRFAAYCKGVTTVMCGSIKVKHIKRNIASIEKGPLPQDKIDWLRHSFGHIARAIGN